MVVRIDEARHDQSTGRVDDFVHAVGRKIGADRNDLVVFDQDIGDRRLMDVALMVIDLAAADQHSFRCHLRSILLSRRRRHEGRDLFINA